MALGILVSRAARVTDGMIMAAAKKLASLSPALKDANAPLLPPIAKSHEISQLIAQAVAQTAIDEGVAELEPFSDLESLINEYVWEPVYLPYERIDSPC